MNVPHYSVTIWGHKTCLDLQKTKRFSNKRLAEHTLALVMKLSMLYCLGFLRQLNCFLVLLTVCCFNWKTIKMIWSKNEMLSDDAVKQD